MANNDPVTNQTPGSTHSNAYRLLYRGALSLPDSHILLDGLTFAARHDSPSKRTQLLQNPLALALESMRGRPSLRFIGVVSLDDDKLWLDESGGIEMLVSLTFFSIVQQLTTSCYNKGYPPSCFSDANLL